jgi:tetratricopeptide (TPR) repeat protein
VDREFFQKVEEIFVAAIESPESERASLVERMSDGDAAVAEQVMKLLGQHEQSAGFLEPPLNAKEAGAPSTIGPFRIVKLLGAGGTGTVYEAEQSQPQRRVALKVLRSGAATRGAMRRFEAEAHVLGALRHSAIAQVYQAGVHEADGVSIPYFAMELVPGARTVSEHATEAKLDLVARLRLFLDVCAGVAHAHQRGVIHRDLKPGNILVDEAGGVKVIDFGLARVLGDDRSATLRTDAGQIMGTLAYMSPEHCEGRPSLIETRSDVYCLGVVLYELLCGRTPHDLSREGFAEAARIIRDVPPERPGAVVAQLRGDLETVILKALEKDPARRYQSVGDFARDIERYLSREPVEARPPSVMYQMRLFTRRNRALVTGGAVAVAALVVATGVSAAFAVRAGQEATKAQEAKQRALDESARRAKAAAFMLGALSSVNPFLPEDLTEAIRSNDVDPWAEWSQSPWPFAGFEGNAATARDVLIRAAERMDEAFADDALIRAELSEFIGWTLVRIEEYDEARPLMEFAAQTRLELLGPDHADTIRACLRLAEFCDYAGPAPESTKFYKLAMESCDRNYGMFDPRTLRAQRMLANNLCTIRGDAGLATNVLEERLALAEEAGRADDPVLLVHRAYTGMLLALTGRIEAGEAHLNRAVEKARAVIPAGDIRLATIEEFFGRALEHSNPPRRDVEEALSRVVAVYTRYFGPVTMQTLNARRGQASVLDRLGERDEARRVYTEVLAGFEKLQGKWSGEATDIRMKLAALELAAHDVTAAGTHTMLGINGSWASGDRRGDGVLGYGYVYADAVFRDLGDVEAQLALTNERVELLRRRGQANEIPQLAEAMMTRATQLQLLKRGDDARIAVAAARAYVDLNARWLSDRHREAAENLSKAADRPGSAGERR